MNDIIVGPTDQHGTANNSRPSSSQAPVQNDRQRLVRDDVAQKKCDQNPMLALAQQTQHSLCVPLLGAFSACCDDLQVCLVLSHQCDCQTSHDAAQQDESDGNAQIKVQIRVAGVLGQLLFRLVRAAALKQRHCAGKRQHHQFGQSEHGRTQAC
jgi:hypothetical protein